MGFMGSSGAARRSKIRRPYAAAYVNPDAKIAVARSGAAPVSRAQYLSRPQHLTSAAL